MEDQDIYSSPADKYPDLPSDIPLAISYLEKSANTGNHQAMYSLGKTFADQDSNHYDIDKALGYLKKSANKGNKKALRENARKNPHKHSHNYDPET